jgi:malonyl-CoA O-methyltransferase
VTEDRRKQRIAKAFSASAGGYDAAADVQWLVAQRVAARIEDRPFPRNPRVLEIGCGTGFLSSRLAEAFPQSELVLTDIAGSMLDRCRARVGDGPTYKVMDGETPQGVMGPFDLIASSLAVQWFVDLKGGLGRLASLLAPGGRMIFATLGRKTFAEWRATHVALKMDCGTPIYPAAEDFPWPDGFEFSMDEEVIMQPYADGADFVRSLKALGAGEPSPGHHPLSPGAFRRLLAHLENGFDASYHILYAEIRAPK